MSDPTLITVVGAVPAPIEVVVPSDVSVVTADALGPQGPEGPPNDLSIGTVTTLPAGSAATASITGTSPSQQLSLGIPEGPQGATGPTGPVASIPVSANGVQVDSTLTSLGLNGALVSASSDGLGNVAVAIASPTTVPLVDGGNF